MALQKEIWEAGIKENPIHDTSFVMASTDKSEFVNNNTLHLAEAGIDPIVHEDFFAGNAEGKLPITNIDDIPHEVILKTYSTEPTRHRDLEEVELQYDKRTSIINRHRKSIAQRIGKTAAYQWTTAQNNEFNKLINFGANDSIIDGITDLRAFYMDLDVNDGLNLCLNAEHWARIKKEDKVLYKDLMAMKNREYCDFTIHTYSQVPLFTAEGQKKAFGAVREVTDKRASFTWVTDEVFRCFGDVKMYEEKAKAEIQADLLSFAQRSLVGNIRANAPKYLGTII